MAAPTYSRLRRSHGGSPGNNPSEWKRCVVIAAAVLMFVFLMAPGAEEEVHHVTRPNSPSLRNNDPSQNGGTTTKIPAMESIPEALRVVSQEPPTETATQEESEAVDNEAKNEATTEAEDTKKLEDAITAAIMDVDNAEEEELQANQSMLTQGVKKVEDLFKFGLGKLFGNSIDVEEMSDIAKEVSNRLEEEVQDEFRKKADALADKKAAQIEDIVEVDEADPQISTKAIRADVKQAEEIAVSDLEDEIDAAAKDIAAGLKEKALEIEKEVVNEHLATRGVHVEVKDGELKKDDDDDPSDEAGTHAVKEIKEEEKDANTTFSLEKTTTEGGNGTEVTLQEEAKEGEDETIEVSQGEAIVGKSGTDEASHENIEEGEDATDAIESDGTEVDETNHGENFALAEEAIEKEEEGAVNEDGREEETKAANEETDENFALAEEAIEKEEEGAVNQDEREEETKAANEELEENLALPEEAIEKEEEGAVNEDEREEESKAANEELEENLAIPEEALEKEEEGAVNEDEREEETKAANEELEGTTAEGETEKT